jgi:hypothetical protein
MAGIARNIELYNSAYGLAWKHISERLLRGRLRSSKRVSQERNRYPPKRAALIRGCRFPCGGRNFKPNPPKERAREQCHAPGPNNRVSRVGTRARRGPENNVCRVAPFLFSQYIAPMLWRVRNSRGRPLNAPARFHPPVPANRRQVSRLDAVWAAIQSPRNHGKVLAFKRMTVHGSNCPAPTWSWTAWESRAVRGSFISKRSTLAALDCHLLSKIGSKSLSPAIATGNPVAGGALDTCSCRICIRDETGRTNPKYSSKHS